MKNGAEEEERRLLIPHGSFRGDPPAKVTAAASRPAPPVPPERQTHPSHGRRQRGWGFWGSPVRGEGGTELKGNPPHPPRSPVSLQGAQPSARGGWRRGGIQGGERGSLIPRSPERPPGTRSGVPGVSRGCPQQLLEGRRVGGPRAEQRCPTHPQLLLQLPGLSFPLQLHRPSQLCSLGTAPLSHHPRQAMAPPNPGSWSSHHVTTEPTRTGAAVPPAPGPGGGFPVGDSHVPPKRRVITAHSASPPSVVTVYTPLAN